MGDMYKAVLMISESNAKDRKEFIEFAIKQVKDIRAVNDDDFKKAERNLKHVEKELDEFEHRVSKAGAIICLMRISALLVRMARGSFISIDDVNNPERELKVSTKVYLPNLPTGINQNSRQKNWQESCSLTI